MNIITLRKSRLFKAIIAVLFVVGLLFVASQSSTPVPNRTEGSPSLIQVYEILIFTNLILILPTFQSNPRVKKSFYLEEKLGNFEPHHQAPQSGPGEGGRKHLLRPEQRNEASQSISEFGINMVCSDEISLSRTIKDTRLPE